MTEDDHRQPTNEQSENQKTPKTRQHDPPLTLHPMTEDEVLRRLLAAGPLPDKERTPTPRAEPYVAREPKKKPTHSTRHKRHQPKQS